MRVTQKFISAAALLMLASCTTTGPSQHKYEISKAAISGSPKLKQREIDQCTARIALRPAASRQITADLANTTIDKMPRVFCTRIWDALGDGRVTYHDYLAINEHNMTPNMIKVIQGR